MLDYFERDSEKTDDYPLRPGAYASSDRFFKRDSEDVLSPERQAKPSSVIFFRRD